jgi:hypothetical protein
LSTTNRTWPDQGSNSGRRGGKPATNRFSYGAPFICVNLIVIIIVIIINFYVCMYA